MAPFNKTDFERLIEKVKDPLETACEELEGARDDYDVAEDSDEREDARQTALTALQDMRSIVNDEAFTAALTKLEEG